MSSRVDVKSRPPNTVVRRSRPVNSNIRKTANANNNQQTNNPSDTNIGNSQDNQSPNPSYSIPYEEKVNQVNVAPYQAPSIPQNYNILPTPQPTYQNPPPPQPQQVQPRHIDADLSQVQVPAVRPLSSFNRGGVQKQDTNKSEPRGSKILIKKQISYVGNENLTEDEREQLLKAAIEKRKNLPAPKKRIGWIREDPDYVPCFFGNSCRDWIIIFIFLVILYAFVIALGILILWLSSFETDLVLGIYGIIGLIFMFGLSLFIYEGQKFYEVRRLSEAYVEEYGDKIK